MDQHTLRVALIVNPLAGLGGTVALKGSDGVAQQAIDKGAKPRVFQRVKDGLQEFAQLFSQIDWYACPEPMGAQILTELNLPFTLLPMSVTEPTTATDTMTAAMAAKEAQVDLILFAGGDGTARDILSKIDTQVPVLGIPAGVKIHSGVYAVTPHAAGEVLATLVKGELVDIREQEVRDIDEEAFRHNQVKAKYCGEMRVPQVGQFVQHTKSGGREVEELVLQDIAAFASEHMDENALFLIGSGKTPSFIADELGVSNTLLGIDAAQLKDGQLQVTQDCTEQDLLTLLANAKEKEITAFVSIIGGQGHLFGRGNQQFSPEVIRLLGKDRIQPIATKSKLKELEGRPIIVDTGDRALDQALSGHWRVLTGYDDFVMYPVTTY